MIREEETEKKRKKEEKRDAKIERDGASKVVSSANERHGDASRDEEGSG
jgi:hypothetical protein